MSEIRNRFPKTFTYEWTDCAGAGGSTLGWYKGTWVLWKHRRATKFLLSVVYQNLTLNDLPWHVIEHLVDNHIPHYIGRQPTAHPDLNHTFDDRFMLVPNDDDAIVLRLQFGLTVLNRHTDYTGIGVFK